MACVKLRAGPFCTVFNIEVLVSDIVIRIMEEPLTHLCMCTVYLTA